MSPCPYSDDLDSCLVVFYVFDCGDEKSTTLKNTTECGECTDGAGGGTVGVNTEDEDTVVLKSDCKNLKELSLSKSFNSRINELMQNNTGNTEVGYWGRTNSEGEMIFDSNDRFEGNPNQMEIETPLPSAPIDSYMPNHFNNGQGTLPIFSGSDLATVYNLYTSGSISDLRNFLMIVTTPGNNINDPSDDTIYAVTVSNTNEFVSNGELFLSNSEVIDAIFNNIGIDENVSASVNEKKLAEIFKNQNLGMSLYRGDRNNFENWTRVKVDNSGNIKENNCN